MMLGIEPLERGGSKETSLLYHLPESLGRRQLTKEK